MEEDVPNWQEEVFIIKVDQNTLQWTCVIIDLNGKEIVEKFYEKKLKKNKNQKEFRIEKEIKRKCNKLFVKWKFYYNSFNSQIDKEYIVK